VALLKWEVTLSASGEATVTVWAADADTAGEIALKTTPGMIVDGGACDWNVEDVREVDGGES